VWIAGFWFKSSVPEAAEQWLKDSVTSLHHRGPDDSGLWFGGGVGLGHARLSILDLSPLGHQPMASRNGRWVMVFNGEVYNFREIRKDLETLATLFSETGDSEVILEAFSEWGPGAVRRFVGMFAIALWSKADHRLYLLRDRLGVKPLYYGWNGNSLWFGSELKALRAFKHWAPQLDRSAMADYFRYGYSPSRDPFTITSSNCPPGTGWSWVQKGTETRAVLERARCGPEPAARQRKRAADELEALMIDAFRYRMISGRSSRVFFPVASTPQCSLRSCSDMEASGSRLSPSLRRT